MSLQDLDFVPSGWSGLMTPFVALNVQDYLQSQFDEKSLTSAGAPGILGLAAKANSDALIESLVGAQLTSHFMIDDYQIDPYLRAAYQHEFVRDPTIKAAFEAAPDYELVSKGAGLNANMARFDLGATISLRPDFGLYVRATEALGATAHSTSGTVGAVVRW
jgi:outer membrane autotransporter protein